MIKRISRSGIFVACLIAGLSSAPQADAQQTAAQQAEASQIIQFNASEELKADDALGILTKKLDLNAATDELRSQYIEQPGDGLQVQRFHQYFKGIDVAHGSMAMTSKNGIASYAFGKFYRLDPATSITPTLSESDALKAAIATTGAKHFRWESEPETYPKGTIVFVENFMSGAPDGAPRLAYAFDIYTTEPLGGARVYIDARTGEQLLSDALMKTVLGSGKSLYSDTVQMTVGKPGARYYLHDSTRGNGIFTYNLMGGTNRTAAVQDSSNTLFFAGGDPGVDAHWGAQKVYDYWKNVHNRLSWNGTNGALKSYVHYKFNYNNAFWDVSSGTMNYGDGTGSAAGGFDPLTSIDVCGHEIGHGVCQSTAGLVSTGEAGGLNEGLSDIWGALIEDYANPHEVDAKAKDMWTMGEEIGINPIRSMREPKLYGNPDCYGGDYWTYTGSGCTNNTTDACGIHSTCGVLTHWFYLLCVGGKGHNDIGNDFQVKGIGTLKGGKIVYATELTLNSAANFTSIRTASIAAATTLYGACSAEVEAVTRAWYAVGLGSGYTPCAAQVSFGALTADASEASATNACNASHTASVPVVLQGIALAGGSATVTATPIGGTAAAGIDYNAAPLTDTFKVGGATTLNLPLIIYDNAYVGTDKYIDYVLTLNAGSSNALKAAVLDTMRIIISNNDRDPEAAGTETHQALNYDVAGTTSSPFYSSALAAHAQYIYKASELRASGLRPGAPITSADFYTTTKASTQPYAGFTMQIAHTPAISLANGFITGTGAMTVYSGNLTTYIGANTIPFSTPFVWNGTDNIVVEFCFTNTSKGTANDKIQAQSGSYYLSGVAYSTSASASGCALSLSGTYLTGSRPIINFTQQIPATRIADVTTDTRSWKIAGGATNYFYTADSSKLIAGIDAASDSLSCLTAKIAAGGGGFVNASGGALRSVKEWNINTSGTLNAGATFDATLYITKDELGGVDPGSILMVQTSAPTDAAMNPSNTNFVSPANSFDGTSYIGFRGTFSKMGRFFLSNGKIALGTGNVIPATGAVWTGANPFTDAPVLYWSLPSEEHAAIRLYDVTGKMVWQAEQTLSAGSHSLKVGGGMDLAQGNYVLQVVRAGGVMTQKMMKK